MEDVLPHFKHNITHSLVRDQLLVFVLVFLLLEVRRNSYWRIILGMYGVSLIGRFTTRV
jgi:hypothetical protein